MEKSVSRTHSLYFLLIKLLTGAMGISVVFFLVLQAISENALDRFYSSSSYAEKKDEYYIQSLQSYVTDRYLSVKDTEEISAWVRQQKVLYIQIYMGNVLVYDSSLSDVEKIWEENIEGQHSERENSYEVKFREGTARVFLYGSYAYQLYNYALVAELLLTFILFVTLVITGIRRKIHYVLKLRDEIELLESGNLDYQITVQGKDELAQLARGLECMRKSFKEQVDQENQLVKENQKIVTEMSHDLRTPLTSIMLYTEILKKGAYRKEPQLREYIEKIDRKARRMKQLTDHLFEYSLVSGDEEIILGKPELFEVLFYDLFSETCSYLEQRGFQVDFRVSWTDKSLRADPGYISRIMDNLTSNVVKYADPREPVVIGSLCEEHNVGFFVENAVRPLEEKPESTGIGIQSIRSMMRKMGGQCRVLTEGKNFRIEIVFPFVKNAR